MGKLEKLCFDGICLTVFAFVFLLLSLDNSNPPRPMDDVPGHSVSHQNEIRGDIIEFYNHVYMPKVQQFALRFSNESDVSGGSELKRLL